ncbi:beta-galactosidase [Hymenobacter edaphi]|nr:beta-galactosidase [Hymenobacter edaphi]
MPVSLRICLARLGFAGLLTLPLQAGLPVPVRAQAARMPDAPPARKFFPAEDLFKVGSYYYPEQWPASQWERDLQNIGRLGFDFTHYGEFAWAAMEPTEGQYDFAWLDRAIELAAKNNVRVVLCTPSPTPPAWLTQQHPDVLMVDAEGRTMQHGARQHASWSSAVYRQYVTRIVTELARRYGQNKTVWGWQIDNEPSHYGQYDYSPNAQAAFRRWLQAKYRTVAALNASWGNAFWSQSYNAFEQIRIPNAQELVQQANPHAVLDFKRFSADEAADFVLMQQQTLRQYVAPRQWITTNLMPDHAPVDPLRLKQLDLVTYTKYLAAGYDLGTGEQGFRLGSSTSIGLSNDLFRPITGLTGVMELQPGQVNWGRFNPQTLPGAVRLWMFHTLAGGNEFVCNYRFRQPLSGGEQYHYGIMQPDGVTLSRSGHEYVQVIQEIRQLRKQADAKAKMPADHARRRTAILYHPDNRWEQDYQPQTNQWSFWGHLTRYYRALKACGAPVDVIDESHDFAPYPVLVAPAYQLLDQPLVARWRRYAEQGGHLVLTSRTGQKDREAHLWEQRLGGPIHELIGTKEIYFDLLPESLRAQVQLGAASYAWNNWGDVLDPAAGTEAWATYADQFYRGRAAVLHRRLGKGSVTYIGPDTDDGRLEEATLRRVYAEAGIPVLTLPEGVTVEWSRGLWYGLNYSSEPQTLPVPAGAKVLLGSRALAPAGVVVWKD